VSKLAKVLHYCDAPRNNGAKVWYPYILGFRVVQMGFTSFSSSGVSFHFSLLNMYNAYGLSSRKVHTESHYASS
jgi:catechol-2,3-dioxygenase